MSCPCVFDVFADAKRGRRSGRVSIVGSRQRRAPVSVLCGRPRGAGCRGSLLVGRARTSSPSSGQGCCGVPRPRVPARPRPGTTSFAWEPGGGVRAFTRRGPGSAPRPGRCCSPRPLCRRPAYSQRGPPTRSRAYTRPGWRSAPCAGSSHAVSGVQGWAQCQAAGGLRRRWPPPDPAAHRRPRPRLSRCRVLDARPAGRQDPERRPGICPRPLPRPPRRARPRPRPPRAHTTPTSTNGEPRIARLCGSLTEGHRLALRDDRGAHPLLPRPLPRRYRHLLVMES